MLDGKLRIAPTCYHVLHLIPVMIGNGIASKSTAPIKDVSAQDLVAQAYKELIERQELKEEYGRVAAIAQKWGY